MKELLLILAANLASVVAIVGAIICAVRGVENWPVFLVAAIFVSKSLHWKEGK